MRLEDLLLIVVLALGAARVTRLIFKDEVFKEVRDRLVLALRDDGVERKDRKTGATTLYKRRRAALFWRYKLATLITCPYCSSAYVSAGMLLAHRIVVRPVPVPVWQWLAIWMGAVMILEYTDGYRAQPPRGAGK